MEILRGDSFHYMETPSLALDRSISSRSHCVFLYKTHRKAFYFLLIEDSWF